MQVLKFRLKIKIDDFTHFTPHEWTEITDARFGLHWKYVTRKIMDMPDMEYELFDRRESVTDHRTIK